MLGESVDRRCEARPAWATPKAPPLGAHDAAMLAPDARDGVKLLRGWLKPGSLQGGAGGWRAAAACRRLLAAAADIFRVRPPPRGPLPAADNIGDDLSLSRVPCPSQGHVKF